MRDDMARLLDAWGRREAWSAGGGPGRSFPGGLSALTRRARMVRRAWLAGAIFGLILLIALGSAWIGVRTSGGAGTAEPRSGEVRDR